MKRYLTHDKQLDREKYGYVVDMATFTAGGQNVLCLATTGGKLCGLDLRTSKLAWDLTNSPKYGRSSTLYSCHLSQAKPCYILYLCIPVLRVN